MVLLILSAELKFCENFLYKKKGMATHSSILAWRILWTEDGRLQSMGSQRAGHDWSDLAHMHKFAEIKARKQNWGYLHYIEYLYL